MGPVEAAIIITVCLYWAVSRSRAEYGHVRDKHLGQIQRDHPDWSPRRQRRLAKHRARGYWAHQIGNGFPDMRNAFRENRELAKVERAEAEAAGAKRWADYRRRLEAAHAEREKYVAEQVSKDPAADKTAARKAWFDRRKLGGALRTGIYAAKIDLKNGDGRPAPAAPAATAPGVNGPDGEKSAARKPDAGTAHPEATPSTAPRTGTGTERRASRRCATCDAPVSGREFLCTGCTELAELTARIRDLKTRRDAATEPAERERVMAELIKARQRRNDLHRAMEARKANGGRVPESAKEPAKADEGPSADQRCQRCNTPASRLYPHQGAAICGDCIDLANARAASESQPGATPAEATARSRADAEATPGSPGDQADPVYATDEPATTDSPSTEGGVNQNTNTTEGIPVEAPSFEAAVAAATAEAENLRVREVGVEQFIADLLAGGMGNDQETINHFAQAQEYLASARAAFHAGVQSMGKHQQGVEYADTGHAAKTEWLATK